MAAATVGLQRRGFLSISNILSSKKHFSERKLLNFSQNQLYNVVSNVDDYYLFVPYCIHSKVYSTRKLNDITSVMQAELGVGFKLFKEKYMSEVTCQKPSLVKAVAADASLFNDMVTTWRLTPNLPKSRLNTPDAANHPTCWIDFDIMFQFASPVHAQASSVFFDQVSRMTLQAFIDRCHAVYKK